LVLTAKAEMRKLMGFEWYMTPDLVAISEFAAVRTMCARGY